LTTSDHNYDYGSLYIESNGAWRVITAPAPGPQPYTTGGDIVLWLSRDQGRTWRQLKQLTHARPDFYALWADGDTLKPSESSLYFTDKEGTAVWRQPKKMTSDFARPEKVE
jgi:hypothetical protein